MQIVPVIDLLRGQVVRGIAGQRSAYQPIKSQLVAGSEPRDVARAVVDKFGAKRLYVADLDAIQEGEPGWELYRQLSSAGAALWIDAGLATVERARQFDEFMTPAGSPGVAGVIAGLESQASREAIVEMLHVVGPERLIFSLDLKSGLPLTKIAEWQAASPGAIARDVYRLGVRRFIVLDLAGVGVGAGVPTLALCRHLRAATPDVEIISGGGVRGLPDLRALADAGCDAALVASALHDGRLSPADVRAFEGPAGRDVKRAKD